MPAHAPAPRGAHRHALRAQGDAAATSTPRPRSRLLRLGLMGVLVLCLQGFSPSAWVAPAVAQGEGGGTLLIDETFTGPSVPNPDFTVHRSTCLTGASGTPPDGQAQIPDCKFPSGPHGPVPPIGVVPGYLQLTDARGSRAGDILYNRPIPATAGLIATFDQWQYGGSTAGDGMAFFLIDGATQLTQIGGGGGSLGYAQRLVLGERGILGGVLGLGLDAFGNYYNDDEGRGTGCPLALKPPFPLALAPDVVTLRGPGDLEVGYCYLGSTTVPGTDPPQSSLPRSLRAERLELAERRVRITVQPTTGSVAPRIIVEIDFHDGKGLQIVLALPAPPNLPATYKFGWTGTSTGADDVHLLRNVVVSTVAPLHQLDLVKQLDRTTALPDPLVAGSVVPYQFLVTNGGLETLTALKVQDATLGTVACPTTPLRPAPALGSSVVCTGAHTLTQAEVDAGVVINTATATALNPGSQSVLSNPSTVTLVVGAAPRLALTKFVVERPPYTLGQPVTFRYHLTNEGNVTLTDPRVTDNKVVDVVCSQPPALLQSPLRSAPAFSAATVCTGTHVLQASDLDANGVFTNTAHGFATAPDGLEVSSEPDTVRLPVGTDIAVTKGVEPPAPVLGEVVTYTVTATNQGPVDATGVQVTDVLPAGTPFLADMPAPGTTYEPATGIWTIGTLAPGASAILLLQGRVTATEPQTNVAGLTALGQVDINPANNQAAATVEEQTPFADLAVTQTVSNATPLVGETVTFTVTATNHGPDAASGLKLSDGVRAGLTLVLPQPVPPSQGTYTPNTGVWDIGELAVGAQATLTLVAQVVQAGEILNVATKTAGEQLDPIISNNYSVVALTSEPVADLQVHKTADQRVLPLGSDVTFTVTVTNAGPSAASGVAVTDALPEGLALVSFTPSQGTYTPATGEWALGALAADTQTTLTLRATVEAVGPLTNRAAKTAQTERDPNPANDASGVTVNGQAADVQVVTTVDRPTPLLGETVTFTVTVTNNGPNVATGVQVRDALSERLTFVGATASHGTYTAATGLWEVGTLPRTGAAATATLQIRATVTRVGPLTHLAAKINQDQPDPNPTNDQDRLTLPGQPLADLVVTKSNGVRSVVPGTEVTYTVVVTNRGPSAVTGATVSDPIPLILVDPSQRLPSFAGLTWTCVASAGSLCPVGGTGNVLATVDLLVGGTATFTLRGRVTPTAVGTVANTATVIAPAEVLDPLPGTNSATDTDRLTPLVDLRITKTDHGTGTAPGGLLLYTLLVTNTGPSAVTGARVVDPVPTALTGVTWTCTASPGSQCLAAGTGAIDVTVDLLAGGTATFTILATVDPAATGTLVNQATVTGPPGTVDSDGSNNTATEPTEILPIPISTTADLTLVKTDNLLSTVPGAPVQYTLVVRNNGPDDVQGAAVIDAVPATLTEVTWLCRASPGSHCPTPASGTGPLAVRVDLLSDGLVLFRINATVAATASGTLRNIAAVLPPPGTQDPTPGNNVGIDTDTVTTPSTPSADLTITKTDHGTGTAPGGLLLYTLVVTNQGPSAVTGARVVDPVPAGLTGVTWSCTSSPGSQCPAAGTGGIDVTVDLLAGGTTTFTILATVAPAATGTLVNQATVTGPPGTVDPDGSNNTATEPTEILPGPGSATADLTLVKTNGVGSTVPGATVQYTLVVRNNGPDAVQGATVIDAVPATLTEVIWTCRASPGSRCPAPASGTGPIAVRVDLLSDGLVLFRIDATVAATASGPLRNVAAVLPPPGTRDPTPGNNVAIDTDTVTTPSTPSADLTITKTDHGTGPAPGGLLLYTLVVTNQGPSAVTGARVVDPVPTALTGVTWTCTASPGSQCPAAGTGGIDVTIDLLAGGTATFTILATVDPAAIGTLVNQATVTGPPGTVDPDGSNNTATEPTEILPIPISTTADLTLVKTNGVSSTVPGATVQYTLVVRNNGPDAVQGATVIDAVPATLTEVIWTCRASPGSRCPAPASGTGPIAVRVDLLSGGVAIFRIRGTVAAPAGGTLRNVAAVLPPPGTRDPTPGNNVVIDTDTVTSAPVGPGPAVLHPPAGRKTVQTSGLPDLEWRVVWRNNANALPLLVRLLEPIPAATTYVDGSVTCVAQGLSIVESCDFDAATNQLVAEATLGADLGATTEDQAANDVVITFQSTVLPGATEVTNQALAHWDANGNGTVDDDIQAVQGPVRTGTAFGQNDPTLVTLPGLVCLFQQRLLALTVPPSAPTPSATPPSDGADGGSGPDAAADAGVDRQSTPESEEVFVLLTPLDSDTVAGSTLTLAAGQVPVAGTTVSQPTEIRIANGAPAATLALVENVGSKTERIPAGEAHVVLTVDGVVVAFPATALAAPNTLRLERVDPTTAPGPLPGVAVSPLVAVTLAGGGTAFSSAVALSLPYADADQDGLVDETSPALPELSLTMWVFDAARGSWMHLPEARVLTAVNALRVATTQTGLYGVFQAADGRTGLAGTTGPASPAPRSAAAQGSGWQDIGEVTTFPFLVPLNTTTLPNGTYEVRAICATTPADLRAAAGSVPTTSTGLGTSGGGGGGCSLHPGGGWSWATALDAVGTLGVPLAVLLVLGLWVWRRPHYGRGGGAPRAPQGPV